MPVKKYEPKKEPTVEAILLTEDNAHEVARFCGGLVGGDPGDHSVSVPSLYYENNYFTATPGDYVYRDSELGAFDKMGKIEFERKYDEVNKNQSFLHDHKQGMRSAGQVERVISPYKSDESRVADPYDVI